MREELKADNFEGNDPESSEAVAAPELVQGDSAETLSEDLALSQLKDRNLSPEAVEQIVRHAAGTKSRKIHFAVAAHPHAPRRIALRFIRELYTFELMQFALMPGIAADLKRLADELLVSRLPSITLGERISLARRSSGLVAGALLLDKEARVWQTALENGRLTESGVVKAVLRPAATPAFVEAVSYDTKWSVRPEIRIALLRSAHTPLSRAVEFAQRIPAPQLRDILHASRLPERIKNQLRKNLEK